MFSTNISWVLKVDSIRLYFLDDSVNITKYHFDIAAKPIFLLYTLQSSIEEHSVIDISRRDQG